MLAAADRGLGGAFNTVGRSGHATMGELLDAAVRVTGSDAELVWASPEVIEEAGISPWIELPIWLPDDDEYGGMHDGDVSAAYNAGLTCRPVAGDGRRHLGLAPGRGRPRAPYGQAPARARSRQGGTGAPQARPFMSGRA